MGVDVHNQDAEDDSIIHIFRRLKRDYPIIFRHLYGLVRAILEKK